jgi:hypothetical protein
VPNFLLSGEDFVGTVLARSDLTGSLFSPLANWNKRAFWVSVFVIMMITILVILGLLSLAL